MIFWEETDDSFVSHLKQKYFFSLVKTSCIKKNALLFLLSFFKIMKDPILLLFTFKSEANGNCLFSAFSTVMCGDNRYVNSEEGFKYFIGYQESEIVKPLCIILPQMSGEYKIF